jgi:hypothetical protein
VFRPLASPIELDGSVRRLDRGFLGRDFAAFAAAPAFAEGLWRGEAGGRNSDVRCQRSEVSEQRRARWCNYGPMVMRLWGDLAFRER